MPEIRWYGVSIIASLFLAAGCAHFNQFPTTGRIALDGLSSPVSVSRDEKGMAYIRADTLDDAIFALGYVTAQDRLFQMTLTRLFAEGRISELAGERARNLDIRHRTLGFHRHAIRHARILEPDERRFYQHYIDGINAYIGNGKASHPLEFTLAGISPEPWSIEDCLAIYYLMGWDMSGDLKTEIVAQMLAEKLGPERAREIFPLILNPDDEAHPVRDAPLPEDVARLNVSADENVVQLIAGGNLDVGSNNWVIGPAMSASGKPVVCDDPHMKTGMLPGPLYPVGIITPDVRVVGVTVPGTVGLPIFRSDRVAVGLTNAYADVQDLFVETIDPDAPDHYLEGGVSIPFTVLEESIRIKDKSAPGGYRTETVTIRLTRRGPVVSDVFEELKTEKVLSVRWAAAETMAPALGFTRLFTAPSASALVEEIEKINVVALNFVFADTQGNIGWQVSGRLPIRPDGGGALPMVVRDDRSAWQGFVPFAQMPHAINPDKGWLGTCNHRTVPHDYPYYYSSYQSPSYRYRRLKQIMAMPGKKTADDHWAAQRDTLNLMAEQLVPFMVAVLDKNPRTHELAAVLERWDRHDDADATGATVFHAIYERFAWLTFADELGEDVARRMLGVWYFWQERFQRMVLTDHLAVWFDDIATPGVVEDKQAILVRAAEETRMRLAERLGGDVARWQWGRVHRHRFVSPIRTTGIGSGLLGAGTHPAAGSVEALYRGRYEYNDPYAVSISAALRMVADLGDDDKVLAVLAGGVSGRVFHPHAHDQIDAFMNGEKRYWWFSDRAIAAHTRTTLVLSP